MYIEPVPQKIRPVDLVDFKIRVGLVLPEDKRSQLSFCTLSQEYSVSSGTDQIQVALGDKFVAKSSGHRVFVSVGDKTISGNKISITPSSRPALKPNSGLELTDVVAGRGFHWQKSIPLSFAGEFEIETIKNMLVVTNIVDFEQYLTCVMASEMGSDCPKEFCKAQAVAARSWSLVFLSNKHPGMPFSVCNDDDCQRYQGTTFLSDSVIDSVRECAGELLIDSDGYVLPAYYSKNCGGKGDLAQNVFGFGVNGLDSYCDDRLAAGIDLSDQSNFAQYLRSTSDAFCSPAVVNPVDFPKYLGKVDRSQDYFRWSHKISAAKIIQNLVQKFKLVDLKSISALTPVKRSLSGRITSLDIHFVDSSGAADQLNLPNQYEIRRALHDSFLYSSAFVINRDPDTEDFVLSGAGWGHGVGLCQIGALGMALKGSGYREILKHYYAGATIGRGASAK